MRNFKIYIDLVDLHPYIMAFDLIEYRNFFMIVFVEASDPDDACYLIRKRIKYSIMNSESTIDARVACRWVNHLLRIEKVYSL